jgi:hypothetical protein
MTVRHMRNRSINVSRECVHCYRILRSAASESPVTTVCTINSNRSSFEQIVRRLQQFHTGSPDPGDGFLEMDNGVNWLGFA